MTKPGSCPHCGATAAGRYCANCGTALPATTCAACNATLGAGASFCEQCGAPAGAMPRSEPVVQAKALAWLVPGIAVLALVAFLIGQRVAGGSPGATPGAADPSPPGGSGAGPGAGGAGISAARAPDISTMSPEERATRLFDRVMRYGEEGKQDSARMFAPMAVQAYEMLGALDAHLRYDIGMIAVVAGEPGIARAEADTILAKSPTHLLGLILAMKAAGLRNDMAARNQFAKRLVAAAPGERAKGLKEYADHRPDIDAALKQSSSVAP